MPVHGRSGGRRDRGFTLIEILVVVTLVLALTAIIAPTFQVTAARRVENVAHQMVAHLELARSEALGSRRAIRAPDTPTRQA